MKKKSFPHLIDLTLEDIWSNPVENCYDPLQTKRLPKSPTPKKPTLDELDNAKKNNQS